MSNENAYIRRQTCRMSPKVHGIIPEQFLLPPLVFDPNKEAEVKLFIII